MNKPIKTLMKCIIEIGPVALKGETFENANNHKVYQIRRVYPTNAPKDVRFHICYTNDLSRDSIKAREHQEDIFLPSNKR